MYGMKREVAGMSMAIPELPEENGQNKELLCGMSTQGHCTKDYPTLRQLASYIRGKYGAE